LQALLRHVEQRSRLQPALICFEDVHWIDPSSRELLDHMIDWITNTRSH
jgi:predicted ATPase